MKRENTMRLWVEKGYANFATHGLEGIQVERIARELGLKNPASTVTLVSGEYLLKKWLNITVQYR